MVNRYDIYWVDLNPTIGSEMNKIRPCIIISPVESNRFLRTVIVAPITSSNKTYKSRINFLLLGKKAQICLDQIRAIDKQRIGKRIDSLSKIKVKELINTLKEYLID